MIKQSADISMISNNPKIGVIGAGSWGTTLSFILSKKEYEVTLWAYEKELVDIVKAQRVNTYYLPDVRLCDSINITNSIAEAIDNKDIILSVVPVQVVRQIARDYIQFVKTGSVIVSISGLLGSGGAHNDSTGSSV